MSWTSLFEITALVAIAFIAIILKRITYNQQIDQIWQNLEITSANNQTFTEDLVSSLPDPARRYFLHSIERGTPLPSSVHLKMRGKFRTGRDATWMPMNAEELIAIGKGFIWKATIGSGFFKLIGADYYVNGSTRMQFYLGGILPVVNASNPDIAKSSIGRLALELIWLPSALLPQYGVRWEALDEMSLQASFEIDGEPVKLRLFVNSDGKVLKVSLARWGDPENSGSSTYIPCGGDVQEERKFGGFVIPSKMSGGWWFDTERYLEFFQSTIESAEFH